MRKILVVCMALLLVLSTVGCSNKEENESIADEKITIEQYAKLVDLSKEEIIKVLGEEPKYSEDQDLEFQKTGIKISVGSIGVDSEVVTKITITSGDVDFNGVKLGSNIEDFRNVFGKEFRSGEGYSDFKYNDTLILSVDYSTNKEDAGKTVRAYILNPME
ncbi:hypothetical protein IZY60_14165 [Lutibacter sp. B2]|nr:hypothetical protein [Lutibacter sp. B2]